jgi:hypothetical protein
MSISESLVRLSASNSTFLEDPMRKLIVAEHISLDGVIQSPGAPDEDPSGDFRLGGWTVPYGDKLIGEALQDLFSKPFDCCWGAGPTTSGPRIGRTNTTPSPTSSTRWRSMSPRIARIRLIGREVMP